MPQGIKQRTCKTDKRKRKKKEIEKREKKRKFKSVKKIFFLCISCADNHQRSRHPRGYSLLYPI